MCRSAKTCIRAYADSEDPDLTTRTHRLIYVFAVRIYPCTCFGSPYIINLEPFKLLYNYEFQKSVIMVDLLGLDKLASSMALSMCAQAAGILLGPTISGTNRIAPGKRSVKIIFSYFSTKIYVVGTHQKRIHSADSRSAVVSFWQKNVQKTLVNSSKPVQEKWLGKLTDSTRP